MKVKNKIQKFKIDKSNIDFLKTVCSKSNMSFHELYYVNSNRYFTCLQLIDFMENSNKGFLNQFISNKNVLVTIDVSNMSTLEYDNIVEKSINKQEDEKDNTKKFTTVRRANQNVNELINFDREITDEKMTAKTMTVRLYVFGKTKDELDENVFRLEDELRRKKCEGTIQTNDLQSDYTALTSFDNPVRKLVSSKTVAEAMMRSEISIVDKNIGLLGYTASGVLATDPYSFKHSSYCKAFIGSTGSGKSALFKRLAEMLIIRGDHIQYFFDIHGEYIDFCKQNGVTIVSINEKTYINLMQIFFTLNDDGVITKQDIADKISSVVSTFCSLNGLNQNNSIDLTVIKQFRKLLRLKYENYIGMNINEMVNNDWFTLGEVLNELNERFKNNKNLPIEEKDMYIIQLCIDQMCSENGNLFDRKTNVDFDLTQSLCFDFAFLRNSKDSMLKASYTELFLNYVSYGFYLNMKRNNEELRKRSLKIYEINRPFWTCDCALDEFMEYAVSRAFLNNTVSQIKYARKAYSSISFMIHATDDLEKGIEHNGDLLGEVFSLSVHKYIGQIDGKSISSIKYLVPVLNDYDLSVITKFKKGKNQEREFMAVINDKDKIPFTSIVTPFQRGYYGGGA